MSLAVADVRTNKSATICCDIAAPAVNGPCSGE
jgi:hypothetical protein